MDFSKIKFVDYLPEGTHNVEIIKVERKPFKQSTNIGILITFQGAQGIITEHISHSLNNARIARILYACQFTEADLKSFEYPMLVGRSLVIKVVKLRNPQTYAEYYEIKNFSINPLITPKTKEDEKLELEAETDLKELESENKLGEDIDEIFG